MCSNRDASGGRRTERHEMTFGWRHWRRMQISRCRKNHTACVRQSGTRRGVAAAAGRRRAAVAHQRSFRVLSRPEDVLDALDRHLRAVDRVNPGIYLAVRAMPHVPTRHATNTTSAGPAAPEAEECRGEGGEGSQALHRAWTPCSPAHPPRPSSPSQRCTRVDRTHFSNRKRSPTSRGVGLGRCSAIARAPYLKRQPTTTSVPVFNRWLAFRRFVDCSARR